MTPHAKLPRIPAELRPLLKTYVEQASRLPQVQRILVAPSDDGYRLWTVIDAPPFDSQPRHEVYSAEQEALQAHDETVDFRLINAGEVAELDLVLPLDSVELFRRDA